MNFCFLHVRNLPSMGLDMDLIWKICNTYGTFLPIICDFSQYIRLIYDISVTYEFFLFFFLLIQYALAWPCTIKSTLTSSIKRRHSLYTTLHIVTTSSQSFVFFVTWASLCAWRSITCKIAGVSFRQLLSFVSTLTACEESMARMQGVRLSRVTLQFWTLNSYSECSVVL